MKRSVVSDGSIRIAPKTSTRTAYAPAGNTRSPPQIGALILPMGPIPVSMFGLVQMLIANSRKWGFAGSDQNDVDAQRRKVSVEIIWRLELSEMQREKPGHSRHSTPHIHVLRLHNALLFPKSGPRAQPMTATDAGLGDQRENCVMNPSRSTNQDRAMRSRSREGKASPHARILGMSQALRHRRRRLRGMTSGGRSGLGDGDASVPNAPRAAQADGQERGGTGAGRAC
ncbi:hypothetical protein BDY21DRAFT_29067 [Lineolata rhizophorae]|uniref:Uncharacterized protein n=1 Tax=Lineolata rhizophorae TaxID=578093 RepID=A0A6A6P0K7_9PEZI|nr:hypothetical protein BDY21DRAFT_29067 [Lineolata rhizophorae]